MPEPQLTERLSSDSPRATAEIAVAVAAHLVPGDVALLRGDLGSGKTAFVRAAANALGVETPVTSPTFAIGNVYSASSCEIAHLDLYRLAELEIADEAVIDDFLTPDRIGFVEWPHDQLESELSPRIVVTFEHAGDDNREIELRWRQDAGDRSDNV